MHVVSYILYSLLVFFATGAVLTVWMDLQASQTEFSLSAVPRFALAAVAAGLWAATQFARAVSIRQPLGLTLDESQILGAWEASLHQITWSELIEVRLEQHKLFGPQLTLLGPSGRRVLRISARVHGSDPKLVAALIRFYSDHPEERHLLTDPERAIERFRASLR